MSYTPAQIADAVWTHATRTVDGMAPGASDGTPIDNIAYAVWTYPDRTASGGVTTFSITVAQTMPAPTQAGALQTVMPVVVAQVMPTPSQAATVQTVMPVTVAQVIPKPVQVITAEAKIIFPVVVAQVMPAPSQVITVEFIPGTVTRPLGAGGPRGAWEYRPPIYTIRAKGRQSAPAPSQSGFARFDPRIIEAPQEIEPIQLHYEINGKRYTLAPSQSVKLRSHRTIKARDTEDQDILALIASL